MANTLYFQKPNRLFLFYAFFLYVFTVSAQTTYIFTASGAQDSWTDASKWIPSYPGTTIAANDAVVITGTDGSSCLMTQDLTINGFLEVMKDVYLSPNVSITVNGAMNLSLSNLFAYSTNSFNNYGTVTNTGLFQPNTCNNYGTIYNEGLVNGTIINQNSNSQIINNGEFRGSLDINQGVFQNNRVVSCTTIAGNLTNSPYSKITPNGNSIGTTAISSNYTSADTLELNINTPLSSDKLTVGGSATISGKLIVKFSLTNALPSVGTVYTLIDAATISGVFDPSNIILPSICNFDVIYDIANGDVKLLVTAQNTVNYTFTATTATDNWSDPTKWLPSMPNLNTVSEYDSILIKKADLTSGVCHINQTVSIKCPIKVYGSATIDNTMGVAVNSTTQLIVAPSGLLNIAGDFTGAVLDSGVLTITPLGNLVGGVAVYSSATLTNSGNLTYKSNSATNFGNRGILNNYGSIVVEDYIGNWQNLGTINNYKKITLSSSNIFWNRISGIVNSSDSILLKQTSTITNDGTFYSTGLIKLDQNPRAITNNLGATFNVSGRLEMVNSGTVNAFFMNFGSIVYGVLSLKGNLSLPTNYTNQVGGVVSPGNSTGIITISGNYTNLGRLEIELKNAPATLNDSPFANNDLLFVAGTATFGGTLKVSLIDGFIPQVGNQWRIVNAASSTGAFSTVQLPNRGTWNIIYDDVTGDVILTVTQVIPVELVAFEAKKENDKAVLNWQTAQEINMSHFEVERSTEGRVFEPIGSLKANGKPSNYEFTDAQTSSKIVYYRLKIYDMDGKSELSKTISLDFTRSYPIKVAPSVFSDILTIKNDNEDFVTLKIVNAVGQTVFSSVLKSTLTIPTSSWQNGVYIVQIKTEKNDYISAKIIKQ